MACAHETQDEQRSDMQSAFGDLQPLEVRGRAFARAGAKAADALPETGRETPGKERRRRSGEGKRELGGAVGDPGLQFALRADTDVGGTQREVGAVAARRIG